MKNLILSLILTSLTACGVAETSTLDRVPPLFPRPGISLASPEAGIDYPTDVGVPNWIEGRQVLVIKDTRILVNESAELTKPLAGVDYPTDTPMPASFQGKLILVVDAMRLLINVEKAKAGIDFPTDGPAHLDRDFLVWNLGDRRVRLSRIQEIRRAEAGIDYPTDGPAHLDRDFHIMIVQNPDFSLERIVLDR